MPTNEVMEIRAIREALKARANSALREEGRLEAQKEAAKREYLRAKSLHQTASESARLAKEAKEILASVAEIKQASVARRIESLVTQAIRAVFGRPDYHFAFDWSERRGSWNAEPILKSSFRGNEMAADVLDGHGGGVADVISFVLRLVVVRYILPSASQVVVSDEPFRHVSAEHAEGIARMLRMLAEKLSIQFIFVTHQEALARCAGRAYQASLDAEGATILEARMV